MAVLKYLIFGLLFALSGGKLKFWIFPNLTEDVGFFQSFYPIYDYTYIETVKKEKLSDDEDDSDEDQEKQKVHLRSQNTISLRILIQRFFLT